MNLLTTPTPTPPPLPGAASTSAPEIDALVRAVNEIAALLDERFLENPLNDWIAPVATVILALAAVVVAVLSWRAAHTSNSITERHRQEDRAAAEVRFRRGIAVDARDWMTNASWRAKFHLYFHTEDEDGERLWAQRALIEGRLEREGEVNGLRLMKMFHERFSALDLAVSQMSPKEVAKARHPSRVNEELGELQPLLKAWTEDPASVETALTNHESDAAARARARYETLRKRADAESPEDLAAAVVDEMNRRTGGKNDPGFCRPEH